jgi:hypothetical protein
VYQPGNEEGALVSRFFYVTFAVVFWHPIRLPGVPVRFLDPPYVALVFLVDSAESPWLLDEPRDKRLEWNEDAKARLLSVSVAPTDDADASVSFVRLHLRRPHPNLWT